MLCLCLCWIKGGSVCLWRHSHMTHNHQSFHSHCSLSHEHTVWPEILAICWRSPAACDLPHNCTAPPQKQRTACWNLPQYSKLPTMISTSVFTATAYTTLRIAFGFLALFHLRCAKHFGNVVSSRFCQLWTPCWWLIYRPGTSSLVKRESYIIAQILGEEILADCSQKPPICQNIFSSKSSSHTVLHYIFWLCILYELSVQMLLLLMDVVCIIVSACHYNCTSHLNNCTLCLKVVLQVSVRYKLEYDHHWVGAGDTAYHLQDVWVVAVRHFLHHVNFIHKQPLYFGTAVSCNV